MPSAMVMLSARGGGDRPPVIALALGLRERGWDVHVLCDRESANLIEETGLRMTIFPEAMDQRGSLRGWSQAVRATDPPQAKGIANPLDLWAEALADMAEAECRAANADVIISALFTMGLARQVSEATGIGWILINPSFSFGDNLDREWAEDWHPPVIPLFAEYVLLPLAREANFVLHATDAEMDFLAEPIAENEDHVGFLLWEPTRAIPENILGAAEPWRLITTSTEAQRDEIQLVRAAVDALSEREGTTILTLANRELQAELGNLPANALVAGFVPHSPIIQKSELVISHAGHGIVSKCLVHGTPMLLLPWDRDQPGVAARATRLRTSLAIGREQVNTERVRDAVRRILEEPGFGKQAEVHAKRLQSVDGVQKAVDLVEARLG